MDTVRILQVLDKINENSGVSAVVMNYYEHLTDPEVVFDFMVNEPVAEATKQELEKRGSKIYLMPGLSGRNIPRYKKELEKFFKEHAKEYSIIHGHIPNAAMFYLTVAKKYGIPIRILHSHNARGADGVYKKVRNYFLNHLGIRAANRYFACSYCAADYLFGKRNREQVTLLPNAVDLEKYRFNEEKRKKMREEYQVGERLVIGHVGRFVEQKNHAFIIEIANELKKHSKDFVMLLAGDGDLRSQIQQKIKEEQLEENFIFTGAVKNVEDYLQMMDVFILPSLYEGLPVVGVEAQANGLPCVFSNQITREVELTKGVYFVPLMVELWIQKLEELRGTQRSKNGDVLAESGFSIERQAGRLAELYKGMLKCLG